MRRSNHGDRISKAAGHRLTGASQHQQLIEWPEVQKLNWRYRPKAEV
jgi:hypothetical protein